MKKISRNVGAAMLVLWAAACGGSPDVDSIALGQDVAVTKTDGGVVEGTVTGRDDTNVEVTTDQATRSIPKDQIVDMRVANEGTPTNLPEAAKFREYTVPEGTTLRLKLKTPLNSRTSQPNDLVEATLERAVSIGDAEVLPAGSTVRGSIASVDASGKVKGLASLTLHFTSVAAAGRGDHYDIDATYSETAEATKRSDATKVGIGAGAGAVIGGLLGGKSGAAKGAAVGGGAGAGVVLATPGDEVAHPAGAVLTVTLRRAVEVRVPIA